jgi:prepilin-type N-terminal cleavage/methylation domain-containing protein
LESKNSLRKLRVRFWPGGDDNSQSGFTLLETLIAITIMLIAFASILAIQSNSINTSIRARTVTVAAMLLRNEMIDTEYTIQGKTFEEVETEKGGNFPAPFEEYRWTRVIKEIEFPNLNFASGNEKTGGGGDQQQGATEMVDLITKLVTQFLSKAMREVTVTVYFKKSGKELQYSATTYWVDLNHEFQLSQ